MQTMTSMTLMFSPKPLISSGMATQQFFLDQSDRLSTALHYKKGKAHCYFLKAKIYTKIKEYEKAIEYASQGSAISNELNLPTYKKDFFLLISEITYDETEKANDTTAGEMARDIRAGIKYKYFFKDSLDQSKQKAKELTVDVLIKSNQ